MTVATATSVVDYLSDGSITAFAVPFGFVASSDLRVSTLDTASPPVETVLVEGVGYSVSGGGRADTTGQVVLTTAATSGHTVRIRRLVQLTQTTSFRTQGSFSPAAHEAAIDKTTHLVQQLNDGTLLANNLFDFDSGEGSAALVTASGGTAARALASRFADVLNVKDFGAKGDDSTDDTAAIQAAFAAATAASGGTVFFPPGTYKTTAQLTVPQTQGIIICGAGDAAIHGTGFSGPILYIANDACRGIVVRDLRFAGDGQAGTVDGIGTNTASNFALYNLDIRACRYGIHFVNSHDTTGLCGLKFYQNDTDVRFSTTLCTSLKFAYCQFQLSKRCVEQLVSLVDIGFAYCGFAASRTAGDSTTPVAFGTAAAGYSTVGLSFYRCRFEQGKAAPDAVAATNLSVNGLSNAFPALGVTVEKCYFTGANVATHVYLGPYVLNARIVGNVWYVTPSSYDVDASVGSAMPVVIRDNTVSPHLARDMKVNVPTLAANQRSEIRAIKRVYTVTLPLTVATHVKVTLNFVAAGLTNFPNFITRVEVHPQSYSTALVTGIAVTRAVTTDVDIQYEVLTPSAGNGSLIVVCYGY